MAKHARTKHSLKEEALEILRNTFFVKHFQHNARKLTPLIKVRYKYLRIIITTILVSQV